jgi:hypothetical protein
MKARAFTATIKQMPAINTGNRTRRAVEHDNIMNKFTAENGDVTLSPKKARMRDSRLRAFRTSAIYKN